MYSIKNQNQKQNQNESKHVHLPRKRVTTSKVISRMIDNTKVNRTKHKDRQSSANYYTYN